MLCEKRVTHKETWWQQLVLHVMWEERHTQGDVVATNRAVCYEKRVTHKETLWQQLVLYVMLEESHTQGDVVATTSAACYVRREAHTRRRGGNNPCCMLCEKRVTHKETWWIQPVLHVMWEESHTQGDVVATTRAACYVRREPQTRRRDGNNSCCMLCEMRGTHKETWW